MKSLYFLIIIFFFFLIISNLGPLKEGFESYENCIEQGYPNNFCFKVPIEAQII